MSHAAKQESGKVKGMVKGKDVMPTGADFAIWIGPLTEEDVKRLHAYKMDPRMGIDELPVRVGNGAIFQAKKANGTVDREQIDDLVRYASISYEGHDYFGIPGKLFMNYSTAPPYVTVLPCDYTYALYSGDLLKERRTFPFSKSLEKLPQYAAQTELPDFVQAYLSGKVGTPLLMLRDVFGVSGPKLIIGVPPEMLRSPSSEGGALASVVAGWVRDFDRSLVEIRREEEARAEARREEERRRQAEQEEQARRHRRQQQQVQQKMRYR